MQHTHPSRSQPHPINLHLEFLRRTAVGPAIFTVRDVKLGRQISNLHLILSQPQSNGKSASVVEGYITMANITKEDGLTLDTAYVLHPAPVVANLKQLAKEGNDENYAWRSKEPFPQFRRAVTHIQLHLLKPDRRPPWPRSMVDQWIRFAPHRRSGGRWTNDAMGYLVDIFPQVVEQYINPVAEQAAITITDQEELTKIVKENEPKAKYWYPTLSLNLDVKKLLPEGGVEWLFVRVRAKKIHKGRIDLDVEVWDTEDELVALSHHASLVLDTSRNMTRSGSEKKGKI